MGFTGIKDVDYLILENLDDVTLRKTCTVNKYLNGLCKNQEFWKIRLFNRFGVQKLPKEWTWEMLYHRMHDRVGNVVEISKEKFIKYSDDLLTPGGDKTKEWKRVDQILTELKEKRVHYWKKLGVENLEDEVDYVDEDPIAMKKSDAPFLFNGDFVYDDESGQYYSVEDIDDDEYWMLSAMFNVDDRDKMNKYSVCLLGNDQGRFLIEYGPNYFDNLVKSLQKI